MTTTKARQPSLERLLEDLAGVTRGSTTPGPVEVVQTHISVVLLAGDRVFKLKKPVDLGFVDYSTPERRRAFCEAEVALNRRLAPDVYVGVVPVTEHAGRLTLGGDPRDAVDWAVEMRRLRDADRLSELVARDEVRAGLLASIGQRVGRFHLAARRGPDVARWAGFDAVAKRCRDNVADLRRWPGLLVSPAVLDRIAGLTERALTRLGTSIDGRLELACEGHGDLRLEHVYVEDGRLRIIDCVEFSEELRCGDPLSDVAFLVMELLLAGRRDLADELVRGWVEVTLDEGAAELLPFYVAYRAMVRAKVNAFTAAATEVPDAQRARARTRGQAHALLALGELESPRERPGLVLVAGLPGTGKSALARTLAGKAGLEWLRTDAIRKELGAAAGVTSAVGGAWGEGLYTPAWTERTYARTLELATAAWAEGGRVLVDACFASEARRAMFLDAARRLGVRAVVLHLEVPAELARARLAQRTGDPSDADAATHDRMALSWEPFRPGAAVTRIDASGVPSCTEAQALQALRGAGLV
jgi:aminoglycoside phosphotransferase family enzyme/predicted kinase